MIYVVLLWFNCFSILVLFVYLSDFWCVCVEHVLRCGVCMCTSMCEWVYGCVCVVTMIIE